MEVCIQLKGWPFIYDAANCFHDTKGGFVAFDQSEFDGRRLGYTNSLWVNIGILVTICVLGASAIHCYVLPTFPRFSLSDFLLFVGSAALVATYFRIDPPFILFSDDTFMTIVEPNRQSFRPLWHNVVAALYVLLFTYSFAKIVLSMAKHKRTAG